MRGAEVYNIAKIAVPRCLISVKPRTPLLASPAVLIESRDALTTMFGPCRRSFPLQDDRFHCKGARLGRSNAREIWGAAPGQRTRGLESSSID